MQKKVSACLALSILNKQGIISGCEGDLISTFSMLWIYYLLKQNSWMANPSRVDHNTNTLLLAHCTIPHNMIETCTYPTHFESGESIGIKGKLNSEKVTVFRIGGKYLDKLWISNGRVIENTNYKNLCRTQLNIKLEKNKTRELLEKPLGNHLIVVKGEHKKDILDSWQNFRSN